MLLLGFETPVPKMATVVAKAMRRLRDAKECLTVAIPECYFPCVKRVINMAARLACRLMLARSTVSPGA